MLVTADMRTETLLSVDALMFIGAGTGGTGGGIKVTTFFILALAAWSELRGRPTLEAFGREIPGQLVRQAFVVALLGVVVVMGGTMLIVASGPWTLEQGVFEAASAFSTTGLSTGITPELSQGGKIVEHGADVHRPGGAAHARRCARPAGAAAPLPLSRGAGARWLAGPPS